MTDTAPTPATFQITDRNAMAVEIRLALAANDMSVTEFAAAVGVGVPTARAWLHPDAPSSPRAEYLPKIARALGCDVSDLFMADDVRDGMNAAFATPGAFDKRIDALLRQLRGLKALRKMAGA